MTDHNRASRLTTGARIVRDRIAFTTLTGLFLLCSLVRPANAGTISFSGRTNYPVGTTPVAVAVGDFNGDGKLDLVVANAGDFRANNGGISILLGNGDGTFQPATTIGLANNAQSIAVGDFSGDGKSDLVVLSQGEQDIGVSSSASILLGNGDGTFQAPFEVSVNAFAISVTAGDFNRDGRLDMLVGNSNTVSVLLGNGDGSFQPAQDYTVTGARSVAVADFNGDSKQDVAATSNLAVSILLGKGDGTFQTATNIPLSGFAANSIVVGDFNRDGKLDLVERSLTLAAHDILGRLLGNGDGTFQPNFVIQTGLHFDNESFNTSSVTVADFDRDGAPDLALLTRAKTVYVMLGNGDGSFQSPLSFAVGSASTSVAVGDFNGDKLPDLVVTNGTDNNISVLLNTSTTAAFTLSASVGGSGSGMVTISPASIDCGSTCSTSFASGTMVTLTAVAAAGSTFAGWSGACSGTGTCSVTMNSNQAVTATFNTVPPPPDFSFLAAAPTPSLVAPGQSATSTITVTSLNGFNSTISFACAVQPAPMQAPTCAPASVTPNPNGTATMTLTINTSASGALIRSSLGQDSRPLYVLWLPVAGFALMGAALGSSRSNKRKLMGLVLYCIFFGGLMLQVACGGGSSVGGGGGGTPKGTYTIAVTGTSGSLQHSTQVTLTVQ